MNMPRTKLQILEALLNIDVSKLSHRLTGAQIDRLYFELMDEYAQIPDLLEQCLPKFEDDQGGDWKMLCEHCQKESPTPNAIAVGWNACLNEILRRRDKLK